MHGGSNVTCQVNSSTPTSNALIAEGSSNYNRRGPDAVRHPTYRKFGMWAGAGPTGFRQNNHRRKYDPVVQPLRSTKLEATKPLIPPLERPGNMCPLSLFKPLSHSQAERPFTRGYDMNTSPAFLSPSTFIHSGRNTFSVEKCLLNRQKVNYPTYNLRMAKNQQQIQSYPDPMLGASGSFFHRISELSSLEGETVRQEKLKKMRRARKPAS